MPDLCSTPVRHARANQVDLISDVLPFGGLWYLEVRDAIEYAKHYSRAHESGFGYTEYTFTETASDASTRLEFDFGVGQGTTGNWLLTTSA
jgi:hypothetical protein